MSKDVEIKQEMGAEVSVEFASLCPAPSHLLLGTSTRAIFPLNKLTKLNYYANAMAQEPRQRKTE